MSQGKGPFRHVEKGLSQSGKSVAVAHKATWGEPGKTDNSTAAFLPDRIHSFSRIQREEGYVVSVENLGDVPDELFSTWMILWMRDWILPEDIISFEEIALKALDQEQVTAKEKI